MSNCDQQGQLKRLLKFLESYPNIAVSLQIQYHLRSQHADHDEPDQSTPARSRRTVSEALGK